MIKKLSFVTILSFAFSLAIGQVMTGTGGSHTVTKATPAYPGGDVEKATIPLTKMEFNETVFEFGTIMEGEKIKNVFTFTNTGTEPLIITNAKGSCGCTVPEWPKAPILPGETAEMLVQFDSKGKGKVGGNLQSKRVTITSNTDPANTYLTIKGKVDKEEKLVLGNSVEQKGQPIDIKFGKKQEAVTKVISDNPDVDESKVLIYPNPTDGELRIDLREFANTAGSIEIYNAAGSKVDDKAVTDFGNELVFNVTDYIPGIYTASIKIDGKNRIAKRFVVPENE